MVLSEFDLADELEKSFSDDMDVEEEEEDDVDDADVEEEEEEDVEATDDALRGVGGTCMYNDDDTSFWADFCS